MESKIMDKFFHVLVSSTPIATLSVWLGTTLDLFHGVLSLVLLLISIPAAAISLVLNLRRLRDRDK